MMRPDDFEIGGFIIIRDYVDERASFGSDPYEEYNAAQRRQEVSGLFGVPMQVIAIDLPFMAVQLPPGYSKSMFTTSDKMPRPISIDVRKIVAMRADIRFAAAFFAPYEGNGK